MITVVVATYQRLVPLGEDTFRDFHNWYAGQRCVIRMQTMVGVNKHSVGLNSLSGLETEDADQDFEMDVDVNDFQVTLRCHLSILEQSFCTGKEVCLVYYASIIATLLLF
jgi:hypothetical protein